MLILTILSGVALLVPLVVLGWALANIARALEGIVSSLEKVAMGVRAIERETAPLAGEVTTLNDTFEALAGGFGSVERNVRRIVES
ncbi:hypothetical protein [Candidatus Entotheonella palauensis]|uniref:DUF948 domain-containing protein n=1 Tax=Candidatus Entotheonella gemina TaxID=1429439 RepID=W4MC60_9BACT|nr:hypothetical protein [Candidatus Entotheonella palauensis]ETX07511.1 MAG: hypothetical protein ETSY2_10735 [Candidatus Entotheonella gemina]